MSPPNILIIYPDQHRHDCLGAYGNRDIDTPNIDRIARDGVIYRNSFCTYSICTPSRYSLLTGLYVHQHGGWDNYSTLAAGRETFPKLLKNTGYRTSAVGKMHFTPTYMDVGFQEMLLAEQVGPGRLDDDYHRYLKGKGLIDYLDVLDQVKEYRTAAPREYWDSFGLEESNLSEEDYSTTWIGDRAVDILSGWKEEAQLLMVGFIKPHHPHDPPYPWSEKYDPNTLKPLPGWTNFCLPRDLEINPGYFPHENLTEDILRKIMAYYYGSISHIDFQVGRMIDILKRKGIYDNTLIIYTADHGDYLGYHHLLLKGSHLYDPLVKVPLIIKYPGQKYRSSVSDALVSSIDVTTTILGQAGCKPANAMEGLDLTIHSEGREAVFAQSRQQGCYMIRTAERKLLHFREKEISQYYDLTADPFELNNLYLDSAYTNEIDNLTGRLHRWMLFESPLPSYPREAAAEIRAANVPSGTDGHRETMEKYIRNIMQNYSQEES